MSELLGDFVSRQMVRMAVGNAIGALVAAVWAQKADMEDRFFLIARTVEDLLDIILSQDLELRVKGLLKAESGPVVAIEAPGGVAYLPAPKSVLKQNLPWLPQDRPLDDEIGNVTLREVLAPYAVQVLAEGHKWAGLLDWQVDLLIPQKKERRPDA